MSDNYIQYPTDATNTGKLLRTQTRTVGANTVHENYSIITNEASDVQAVVQATAPAGTEGGLVTRNIPSGTQAVSIAQALSYTSAVRFIPAVTVSKDFWSISGSATKTIRVHRIWIGGTTTAASHGDLLLIKRSTANSGGTETLPNCVPNDSANAVATSVVRAYTAVATEGTSVGEVWAGVLYIATETAMSTSFEPSEKCVNFISDGKQGLVLRGTAQSLCFQAATALSAGPILRVTVEWTEE